MGLIGRTHDSSWLQIHQDDDIQGWVSAHYMIVSNAHLSAVPIVDGSDPTPTPSDFRGTVPNPQPDTIAAVTAYKLNVRSGPSLAYGIKAWVYWGQQVHLLGRNHTQTWLKISMDNGLEGWVSAAYITTDYPIASLPVAE